MKRVLISGYYGFGNTGDEAILETLSKKLIQAGIEVYVLSASPEETQKRYNVKAFHRFKFNEIIKALKGCDALISGGGSLFQDVTSSGSLYYYLGIVLLAQIMKKKVYVYSQGIGPINKKMNQRIFKRVINRVENISVRDTASYEELHRIGIETLPINLTADPVFLLEPASAKRGMEILSKAGLDINNEFLVGVAVREWMNREESIKKFAEMSDRIIEEFDAKLVLFPFHYPNDLELALDIVSNMKNKPYIIEEQWKPSEVMSAMGLMHINIGVRLHSLIFSARMGVPMIGISYDPKIDGFLKTMGYESACTYKELLWKPIKASIANINRDRVSTKDTIESRVRQSEELAVKTLQDLLEELEK